MPTNNQRTDTAKLREAKDELDKRTQELLTMPGYACGEEWEGDIRVLITRLQQSLELAISTIEAFEDAARVMNRHTDNECTSVPFWAICTAPAADPHLVSHGIWFDRESAERHLRDHSYRFPKKAFVYCFSGHESKDLKTLYALRTKEQN